MEVTLAAYRRLAEFRHQIRQFLHVSEQAARANGIEPQQHQLMLAIKGLPEGARPTVTTLALRLCLKHHSAVELVNRLVERGAAVRRQSLEDRREVLVELTPLGEEILEKLKDLHAQELQTKSPELCVALKAVVDGSQTEVSKASVGVAHATHH
jgi:DNA-binding MarR family transcriptional regulator